MKKSKILILGGSGLVGSSIIRKLNKEGFTNLLYPSHQLLDLTRPNRIWTYLECNKPDIIIVAAAKVGGIGANSRSNSSFLYDNMMINFNIIKIASEMKIPKLIFLGSSCIYPKTLIGPIKETKLLSNYLEETNEGYALAKISGIKYCQFLRKEYGLDYISLMPCNLYGPNDNYDLENSHVFPKFIRVFLEAKEQKKKEVILWGSGDVLREFMHVDDLANAVYLCIKSKKKLPDLMNVGYGADLLVSDLANRMNKIICNGKIKIKWDYIRPDGTYRKLMDSSLIRDTLGWKPEIDLDTGIKMTLDSYIKERK